MRIIYFLLKIALQYSFRLYFRKIKLVNKPKQFFGSTIYVSNHASAFFDPVILGVLQRPIVFFMTRSDVFKAWLQPISWASHMLPIYREHDKGDTHAKNEEVFKKCHKLLAQGRNLLIFGEGFTDDVFIRRLKPIKKGAARIGFGAIEAFDWKKEIRICAIGINYCDPKVMGSDLLIANSNSFLLNDYKEMYLENPSKAINEVTKRIEILMQEQITHIENKDYADFHENIGRIQLNGMNPVDFDDAISLKTRWENSRNLAMYFNKQTDLSPFNELKTKLENYFVELKKQNIPNTFVKEFEDHKNLKTSALFLKLIFLFPIVLIGLFHFFVPYFLVKRFAEKTFKRPVFWSSIKVMVGSLILALWNIPLVMLLNSFVIHHFYISLAYYFILPFIGYYTYFWFKDFKRLQLKRKAKKLDLNKLVILRTNLINEIKQQILL